MTKLLAIIFCVISFVLFVHSYKLSNDMDSWSELFQEVNMMGDKKARYEQTVYPVPEDVKSNIMSQIGQVGGLDTLADGNLLIFHRGKRTWNYDSFLGNKFNTEAYGPIAQNTLTLIDWKNLNEIDSWGSKLFYMPHGLTVDFEGKIWVTDVGLHQVLKFDSKNMNKPELVLGEAFGNGNDDAHFCKPTDVVVAKSNGHIFVSDGYCNKRVVEFDKNGKFVKSMEDTKKPMTVVHSITMIDSLGLVCTVSREEGRIVCFDVTTGEKEKEITHPKMFTVYGIRYDAANEVLHAATGDNHGRNSTGFTFDASESQFGKYLDEWKSGNRDLSRVHDLTTTPDGSRMFLGQLNSEIDMFSFQ